MPSSIRVLCLGNELVADDALGFAAAGELRRRFPSVDVVFTPNTGFDLLDFLTGVQFLIVVDTIQTGNAPVGTVHVLRTSEFKLAWGSSAHYIGLFETLQLARELSPCAPQEAVVLAVEAADLLTLGGKMHDAVQSSVEVVAILAAALAANWRSADDSVL